jgi:hypothetical protein
MGDEDSADVSKDIAQFYSAPTAFFPLLPTDNRVNIFFIFDKSRIFRVTPTLLSVQTF